MRTFIAVNQVPLPDRTVYLHSFVLLKASDISSVATSFNPYFINLVEVVEN